MTSLTPGNNPMKNSGAPKKRFRLHYQPFLFRVAPILSAVLCFILACFWGHSHRKASREKRAQAALWRSVRLFQEGKYQAALKGDPQRKIDGLLKVAKTWPTTKAGQQAHLYLGKHCMKQSNHRQAIVHFKQCHFQDELIQPAIYAWIGDAHAALGESESAIFWFEKAIANKSNPFFTPRYYKKLAYFYENQGALEKALATYVQMAKAFPATSAYDQAESEIGRLTFLLESTS